MDHEALKARAQRATFLPFAPPSVGVEEERAVTAVLRSGWLTTGPETSLFEEEFRAFVGADAAVALSSCTAGLQLGLVVAGVRPGDVVLTTPFTFPGTLNAIENVGARPALVDVRDDTLNLDLDVAREELRSASDRVGAILPVHYAGHPCDLTALDELAETFDLQIIEDAAHSLPAAHAGRRVGGSRPRVLTSFSFYANKNLTTGEGGMLTGPHDRIERARELSLHGLTRDSWRRGGERAAWRYDVREPGHKMNMTDIAASIGRVQLGRLTAFHASRTRVAARYDAAFAEHPLLRTPTVRDGVESAWHLYPLRLDLDRLTIDRDDFVRALAARNIGSSVHFVPVHLHTYYRERYGFEPGAFPVAERAFRRIVSLPIHPGLTDDDVDDVIAAVLGIIEESAR